jgi:uncharacterized protein
MEVLCRLSYSGRAAMIPTGPRRGTMVRVHRALPLLVLVLAFACSDGAARTAQDRPATLEIRAGGGTVSLEVEVADTPEERANGLMNREQLAPYDGMVFTWGDPVRTSFWMKDTLIPLSIAFWDEKGRILSILDMAPCPADPCPTYDPGVEFVGAVEVQRGLFVARGVEVGDHVELVPNG